MSYENIHKMDQFYCHPIALKTSSDSNIFKMSSFAGMPMMEHASSVVSNIYYPDNHVNLSENVIENLLEYKIDEGKNFDNDEDDDDGHGEVPTYVCKSSIFIGKQANKADKDKFITPSCPSIHAYSNSFDSGTGTGSSSTSSSSSMYHYSTVKNKSISNKNYHILNSKLLCGDDDDVLHSSHDNKVTVYVPYSAISKLLPQLKSTSVDEEEEEDVQETDILNCESIKENNNVYICDKLVRLSINSQSSEDNSYETESLSLYQVSKKLSKNVSSPITSTLSSSVVLPTVSLENKDETNVMKNEDSSPKLVFVQESKNTSDHLPKTARYEPPHRKDLCKLLGLEEDDDIILLPNIQTVQNMAIKHNLKNELENEPLRHASHKKNLAKFLGIDGVNENANMINFLSKTRSMSSIDSSSCHLNDNSTGNKFLQYIKKTKKWKKWQPLNISTKSSIQSNSIDKAFLPPQLRRQKGDGLNKHKNLYAFLGLDDSDSEEIIFIPNKKNTESSNSLLKNDSHNITLNSASSFTLDSSISSNSSFVTLNENKVSNVDENLTENEKQMSNPKGKSVISKEYKFSVEESIAKGFPVVIPPTRAAVHHPELRERRSKKDAIRRMTEVMSEMKNMQQCSLEQQCDTDSGRNEQPKVASSLSRTPAIKCDRRPAIVTRKKNGGSSSIEKHVVIKSPPTTMNKVNKNYYLSKKRILHQNYYYPYHWQVVEPSAAARPVYIKSPIKNKVRQWLPMSYQPPPALPYQGTGYYLISDGGRERYLPQSHQKPTLINPQFISQQYVGRH